MGLPLVKTVVDLVSDSNGDAGTIPRKIYEAPIGTNESEFIDAACKLYRKRYSLPESAKVIPLNKYNAIANSGSIHLRLRGRKNRIAEANQRRFLEATV